MIDETLTNHQYFATVGRGLENIAWLDTCEKLENVTALTLDAIPSIKGLHNAIQGKLFFQSPKPIQYEKLKLVERVFILLKLSSLERNIKASQNVIDIIKEIIADDNFWKTKYKIWYSMMGCQFKDQIKRQKLQIHHNVGTFRISLKMKQSMRHIESFIIRSLSYHIKKSLNLKTDMKDPHLEVYVNVSDGLFLMGMNLTRTPLSIRNYFLDFPMRSTVCYAMCKLGKVHDGSTVMDPMCGTATILIEACKSWNSVLAVGVDCDEKQLSAADKNVKYSNCTMIELIKGNIEEMNFQFDAFDSCLCDVPFGKKFGSRSATLSLLPALLRQVLRTLKLGGYFVILIDVTLHCHLKEIVNEISSEQVCLVMKNTLAVGLGNLNAMLCVLQKENSSN